MQISFFGSDSDFFSTAFFDESNGFNVDIVSATPTLLVVRQPVTGAQTTIAGSGFTFAQDGDPTGGTITGITYTQGERTVASFSDFSWGIVSLIAALDRADVNDDVSGLRALLDLQPITFDASLASAGYISQLDVFPQLTQDNMTLGSAFDDRLTGGRGDDTLRPGDNDGYDVIYLSGGSDLFDFSGITAGDTDNYFDIRADLQDVPARFDIDGQTNTASVTTANGTTTINNVGTLLNWNENFVGFTGSSQSGDIFNYTAAPQTFTQVNLGGGDDTFNINGPDSSFGLRIDFGGGAQNGIVANLETGVISEDGQGGRDQINFDGEGNRGLELLGTFAADEITGSSKDDSFIGAGGDDTIDGGAGFDLIRFDRAPVDGATFADLAAGTINSSWQGTAFSMAVSNVEYLRGNHSYADQLLGSGADEYLQGNSGDDTLSGLGGDDTLDGGNGNDLLIGGDGQDRFYGGNGNDMIDASSGSVESQGPGDVVEAGLGQDTILGHQALYDAGGGIDVGYAGIRDVGGLTIRVQADGSGTAVSGSVGLVNDTFTATNYIFGSEDGDLLVGHDTDRYQGFGPGPGDDTIEAGSGTQDTLVYLFNDFVMQGVTVDMASGTVLDEFGDTDTISGIDQIEGTNFADTMTAAAEAMRFLGNGGDDRLTGGVQDDRLDGGAGNDTVNGGAGNDTAVFSFALADTAVQSTPGGLSLQQNGERDVVGNDVEILEFSDVTLNFAEVLDQQSSGGVTLTGTPEAERLEGGAGNDYISGLDGSDTLVGNGGDDTLIGGVSENDLRDVIFGGNGDDTIDGGYGNDELRGDAGKDTIAGGFGADTVIGGAGDDVLTGSALGDLLFGADGDDFVNGGFGYDRVNGGAGADQFYHLGIENHGSDWIQDYDAAEGDTLVFGDANATRAQFQINVATTPAAGADDVEEAFVIYRPTGQIIWALVDGDGQNEINLRIGGEIFDLIA